jgi:hypothetical protein
MVNFKGQLNERPVFRSVYVYVIDEIFSNRLYHLQEEDLLFTMAKCDTFGQTGQVTSVMHTSFQHDAAYV